MRFHINIRTAEVRPGRWALPVSSLVEYPLAFIISQFSILR